MSPRPQTAQPPQEIAADPERPGDLAGHGAPPEIEDPTQPGGHVPPAVAVSRGILHCRRGEWHSGLHYLMRVRPQDSEITLPGLYYSYLGHALARCHRRHQEGIELAERGVSLEFYQPENWLNLAWTKLLARDRKGAVDAILRGLDIDPANAGLKEMAQKVGIRRPPVLRFLPRTHPMNVRLGRLRHALLVRQAVRSAT